MKSTDQILLIEDNPGDVRLIKEMLKEITSFHYQLITAETLKEGCERIKKNNFILILLDLNLPDSAGKQTFDTVIKFAKRIPVVLVSGLQDLELSIALIKEGAQDYIVKKDLSGSLLAKTVQYALIRRQTEEKLRASEDYMHKIINTVASPIFVKDDKHKFCLVNDSLCALFNLPAEKIIGTTGYEYFPEEQMKIFIEKDAEVFRTGKESRNEEQLTTGQGKIKTLITRKTLYTDTVGNKLLVGVINDITKRKQAETKLKANEERFKLVAESAGEWIWEVNVEGLYTYSSPMVEILLGYTPEEIVGKKYFYDLFQEDVKEQLKERALNAFKQRRVIKDIENPNVHKNGKIVTLNTSGSPVLDKEGNLVGYRGIDTDITERKQFEIELILAKEHAEESDRLKSAFLANMSHEIRTPMNGILGFSVLLKQPNLTGEEQQEYIQIIEKSGARMLNIINDIISISQIESGLMEVHISESNINEQIEFIYKFFKPEVEGKGMQLLFKSPLPFSKANLKTDKEKLYAILTNLVKNAIKYSEEGSIEFGYNKKGTYIEFYVKDTGIGIDSSRQEAIFERFIQADIEDEMARQGAGLGLSISRAYVEILGGKLWVESKKGFGSTFYFTIPCNTERKETVENTLETTKSAMSNEIISEFSGLKILVVEDDETSDLVLGLMLTETSNKILHAKNGLEAIELCRNNLDIDLILMDIKMPVMDGHEATRQIRQFNKDVIIIAQTAHSLRGDKEKAIAAGCNAYISKPIRKAELLSLIQQYFIK